MGKSLNEYKILKQGFFVVSLLSAIIFGEDIRGLSRGNNTIAERVTKVEVENSAHASFTDQLEKNSTLLSEVQKIQAQVITQVENLTTVVNAMQQREYARLSKNDDGG